MAADQTPSRGPGRPRTSQNAGTARGELARWLCDVADRDPKILNSAIAARTGGTPAAVGRALRGETFASPEIVAAVVELGSVTDQERRDHVAWVTKLADLDARYARKPPDAIPPAPWATNRKERTPAPLRRRRSQRAMIAAIAVGTFVLIGFIVLAAVTAGPHIEAVPMNHVEQVANRLGTPVFGDPVHGSGVTGPRIPALARVEVSCKLYAPIFASVLPDGYWYRIESSPWNGQFYAVANTFANGDQPGANPPTNTDRSVPDC